MFPNVDALQIFIKTAAVSEIGLVWANVTVKAFKMAWHIISTSPEEQCQEHFIDDDCENHWPTILPFAFVGLTIGSAVAVKRWVVQKKMKNKKG